MCCPGDKKQELNGMPKVTYETPGAQRHEHLVFHLTLNKEREYGIAVNFVYTRARIHCCELFNNLSQHQQKAWPEDGGEVLENVVNHIWKTSTQENLHYSKNVVEEMDAKPAFSGFSLSA